MKVLILGSKGQLGRVLSQSVAAGRKIFGLDLPELDITSPDSVRKSCESFAPDVVINAAAYTAVDKAESEPEIATRINEEGARIVAQVAGEVGARLIHISTDFVFDGEKSSPYSTEDKTNPLSVYGISKRGGELRVLDALPQSGVILRTAWLYSDSGNNFVLTMLRLLDERDEIGIVEDQIGSPTWTRSLADAIWAFVENPKLAGVFHWTDSGVASWYDFAMAIQEEAQMLGLLDRTIPINPISTTQYPTPARRPSYSVLDKSSTSAVLSAHPPHWRVNLRAMLKKMKADSAMRLPQKNNGQTRLCSNRVL